MQCVFCEIVADRKPASIIYSDRQVIAFMALRPIHPGECLVIPRRHIDHFTSIPDGLAAHLMIVAQRIGRRILSEFQPKRVGIVVHGFGVPHAHLNLVPQHATDDITSGRYARIEKGEVVFDFKTIPASSRAELNRQAQMLRIETEPEPGAVGNEGHRGAD